MLRPFRNLFASFHKKPVRRPAVKRQRTFRPLVEALEDRLAPSSTPLHVAGNVLEDAANNPVVLRGVNLTGLEFRTDGDNLDTAVDLAINQWHANVLRLPVNEDFWFGHNEQSVNGAPNDDGSAYRALIQKVIDTALADNVYVVLDLHWSDMGVWGANNGQHFLPDDHSTLFWQEAAAAYANNPAVLFDPYNEPHFTPEENGQPTDADWALWRDGSKTLNEYDDNGNLIGTYDSPGMQGLIETIRATGAGNVLVPEGLDYGADLTGVINGHALTDPANNLMYQSHLYPGKLGLDEQADNAEVASSVEAVAQSYPIYVGEWGAGGVKGHPSDGAAQQNQDMLTYLDNHPNFSWSPWAFTPDLDPDANGQGGEYNLLTSWDANATTSDYGVYIKAALADAPPPPAGGHQTGFSAAINTSVGGVGPQLIASADFNGDGHTDLAVTNADSSISILLGNGDGTFAPAKNFSVDGVAGPEGIVAGDFNHDGFVDLAVASNGDGNTPGAVTILLGHGDGTFTKGSTLDLTDIQVNGQPLPMPVLPTYLAVVDMNRDGNLDLVVADFNNPHVYVFLGNGDGTFTFHDTNFDPNGVSNAEQVVVADFNGDGIPDIAVANKGNGTVSLFQGTGGGSITAAGNINLPGVTGSIGLAAGDLNGDGLPDLAVADYGTDAQGAHELDILMNTSANGNISFGPPTQLSFGNHLLNVVIADFNEDGQPDLAVSSSGDTVDPNAPPDQSVWVLYNQGHGQFSVPAAPLTSGLNPVGLISADINGDGHADLISANQNSNTVSVFLDQFSATLQASLAAPAQVDYGRAVEATFTLAPPAGGPAPSGTATFQIDGVADVVVSLQGVAWPLDQTVQLRPGVYLYHDDAGNYRVQTFLDQMSAGAHTIAAQYTGDDQLGAVTAQAYTTVLKLDTVVSLTAPASSRQGQSVTLTTTVNALGSGMTGTVTFFEGSNVLGTASVMDGQATLTTAALGVGIRSVTARYEGDNNFNASQPSSAATVQVVGMVSHVAIARSKVTLDPRSHRAVQTITIRNIGADALPLPLILRFRSLTAIQGIKIAVIGQTGTLAGDPLLPLPTPAGLTQLALGQSLKIKVTFAIKNTTRIKYLLSVWFLGM
jgi:hypothetical protein